MGVKLTKFSHQIIFLLLLPLLSIGSVLWFNTFLQQNIQQQFLPLIDSFGILGMYGLLFQVFNKSLWQIIPQGFLGVIEVPNINGIWTGQLRSSFDENTTLYSTKVKIVQTFSEIKIYCYFQRSWSYSIVAGFYKESDGRQVLHYIYRNEPKGGAPSAMQPHNGAAKHEYIKATDKMACYYYNEPPRDRGHYGNYTVKRQKRTFINRIFPTF